MTIATTSIPNSFFWLFVADQFTGAMRCYQRQVLSR